LHHELLKYVDFQARNKFCLKYYALLDSFGLNFTIRLEKSQGKSYIKVILSQIRND